MISNLPYIYEGEVIEVIPQIGISRSFVRYICRVELENGSNIIVKNVEAATIFGGIADYMQTRLRASKDSGDKLKNDNQEDINARIGDRVLISFVGGNIQRPMIVGYLQHPNQIIEIDGKSANSKKPNTILQYLGARFIIDEDGQFTIIRHGAPDIKEVSKGGVGGAISAVASLLGSSNPSLTPSSPAVSPAPTDEVVVVEFLNGGIFRVRDADGQMIELDRTKNRIYISNNDLKSTEDPAVGPASGGNQLLTNSTDAEYVLLDRAKKLVLINARQTAQIYSFNARKDVTDGNHSHKVGVNSTWTIGGNEEVSITGSKTDKIGIKWGVSVRSNIDITSDIGDVVLTGSKAVLKLGKGRVGLGGPTGELLEQVSQGLKNAADDAQASAMHIHGTAVGPTSVPTTSANFVQLQVLFLKLKEIVDSIKGGI